MADLEVLRWRKQVSDREHNPFGLGFRHLMMLQNPKR